MHLAQQWIKLPAAITVLFCVAVAFGVVQFRVCIQLLEAALAVLLLGHFLGTRPLPNPAGWRTRCIPWCWREEGAALASCAFPGILLSEVLLGGCQADPPKSRQRKEEFESVLCALEKQRRFWFSAHCRFFVLLKFRCILVRNYRKVVQHQQGWSVLVSLIGPWPHFFFFF